MPQQGKAAAAVNVYGLGKTEVKFMKETGEGDLLVRLYPRDFWLF